MKILTVNLPDRKHRAVIQRAKLLKTTPDAVVNDLIAEHLEGTMLVFIEGQKP